MSMASKIKFKKIKNKSNISEENSCDGYLIDAPEKEARKIIASFKDKSIKKKIALVGRDDAFNRRAVETLKIDYLVSPERDVKRDGLKQRDSGINHVVAKMAKKKDISIVIDFDEIKKLKGKEKALRLARIMQNIKICRKAKCDIKILGNIDDKKGLISFVMSLGMSSSQARDALKF